MWICARLAPHHAKSQPQQFGMCAAKRLCGQTLRCGMQTLATPGGWMALTRRVVPGAILWVMIAKSEHNLQKLNFGSKDACQGSLSKESFLGKWVALGAILWILIAKS